MLALLDSLFGLPGHPLVVHLAVVLVPLAAVGTIAIAFWGAARRRIGWIIVALAFVAFVGCFLAKESGEALQESVRYTEAVDAHVEIADGGTIAGFAVFVGAAGIMVVNLIVGRRTARNQSALPLQKQAPMIVGVLAVLLVLFGSIRIIQIGHSGAKATWENTKIVSEREDRDE
jgi:drug/metabolite transporter (DMT)-like permease